LNKRQARVESKSDIPASENGPSRGRSDRRTGLRFLVGVLACGVFTAAVLVSAGEFGWVRGWASLGLVAAGGTGIVLYVRRRNPALLQRRRRIMPGTKKWDLYLLCGFGSSYWAEWVVAALDRRWGWSGMSPWWWLAGAVLYAFFVAVLAWAMTENAFFEKTVRIQTELSHRVIDTGPYHIVRHPGYLATTVGLILATPLLLGSWPAFVPALLATAFLALRTILEDRTLRRELPGYDQYARRVRYRLLPGLW
jgi:protein-S-isoprenylcysteine O-methyltransferase Ste14